MGFLVILAQIFSLQVWKGVVSAMWSHKAYWAK